MQFQFITIIGFFTKGRKGSIERKWKTWSVSSRMNRENAHINILLTLVSYPIHLPILDDPFLDYSLY